MSTGGAAGGGGGGSSQSLHDLEERYLTLLKEHEQEKASCIAAKASTEQAQSAVAELRAKYEGACRAVSEKDFEAKLKDNLIKEAEQLTEELKERNLQRTEECDRLKEQIKAQSDELVAQQARLQESHVVLSENQAKLLPLQLEVHKSRRENELLEMSARDLQAQMDSRVMELRKYREDASTRLSRMENDLRTANDDNVALQALQRSTQEYANSQEGKVDSYLKRIKDLEADHALMIATHSHEMKEKDKMVQMCKSHRQEAHVRAEQLETNLAAAKETSNRQLGQLRTQMQAMIDGANEKLTTEKAAADTKIASLMQQLSEAGGLNRTTINGAQDASLERTGDFESMSMTAMYNRVVLAERQRDEADRKRTEAEIYLQRILKDVENKAPAIAAKQRDLNRVLESNSQLSKRLEDVVHQNQLLLEGIDKADKSAQAATEEAQILEQANKDLSAQVQHLLNTSLEKERSSGVRNRAFVESSEGSVVALVEPSGEHVSDYLTTFKDVAELQARNEQLLKVVRKLRLDSEKAVNMHHSVGAGATAAARDAAKSNEALKALLSEVKTLREARQMTEQKVLGLMQQNEMYKLMLAESDAASGTSATSSKGRDAAAVTKGSLTSDTSPAAKSRSQQDAAWIIAQGEEELNQLKDRLSRAEEAERILNESLERVREDASALRLEKAQASSEARHHKERAARLEESVKTAQADSAGALQRRLDLEKIILEQQREGRAKDDKVMELHGKLRQEQDARRRAEIEVEVNQAALARLEKSLADERSEMKRQVNLTESVRNIENSLSKRTEEERLKLSTERDLLNRTLETMRKREAEQVLVDDQRFKSVDENLRAARIRADELVAEMSSLKEELLRSEGTARAAQERCNVLEKQLTLTQERLESVQGNQTMDMILQREAADREVALAHALSEVTSLKNQLLAEKAHAEQFQKISASTEATMNELQRRYHDAKISSEQDNRSLRAEIEGMTTELANSRQDSIRYIEELDEAKKELREGNKDSAERLRTLGEEYALAKCAADGAVAREGTLKAEIAKCQQETREARSIYLREMDFHVKEAKARDDLEKELNFTKAALEKSLQESAELSASLIRQERLLAEEKAKSDFSLREMRERVEEAKQSSDALHNQLEQLGLRVSKSEEARREALNASVAIDGADDAELRRSVDQMVVLLSTELKREKQERQLTEGKLSVSESENASQAQILSATQRALDEARALLHRESNDHLLNSSSVDSSELDRLRSDSNQLNIVLESNAHLRAENEELAKTNTSLRSSLQASMAVEKPLEESIRRLSAEKDALVASNSQLDTDRGFWKDKVTNILSRYNDVDPDEHKALKEKIASAMQEIADTKAALAALSAELGKKEADFSAREKEQQAEITSAKNLVQSLEKTADNFRNKMRKVLEEKAQSQEAVKALDAAKEELLKQVHAQNEHLERVQAQLKAAQPQPVQSQLTAQQRGKQQKLTQAAQTALQPATAAEGDAVPSAEATAPTSKRRRDASSSQTVLANPIPSVAGKDGPAANTARPGKSSNKKPPVKVDNPPETVMDAAGSCEPPEISTEMPVEEEVDSSTALEEGPTPDQLATPSEGNVEEAAPTTTLDVTLDIPASDIAVAVDEREKEEALREDVGDAGRKAPQVDTLNLLKEQLLRKKMAATLETRPPVQTTALSAEMDHQDQVVDSSKSSGTAQLAQGAAFPPPKSAGSVAGTIALNATTNPFAAAFAASGALPGNPALPPSGRGKGRGKAVVPAATTGSIFGGPTGSGFGGFLAGKPAQPLFSTLSTTKSILNTSTAPPLLVQENSNAFRMPATTASRAGIEEGEEEEIDEDRVQELERAPQETMAAPGLTGTDARAALTQKFELRAARFGTKPATLPPGPALLSSSKKRPSAPTGDQPPPKVAALESAPEEPPSAPPGEEE